MSPKVERTTPNRKRLQIPEYPPMNAAPRPVATPSQPLSCRVFLNPCESPAKTEPNITRPSSRASNGVFIPVQTSPLGSIMQASLSIGGFRIPRRMPIK